MPRRRKWWQEKDGVRRRYGDSGRKKKENEEVHEGTGEVPEQKNKMDVNVGKI